MKGVCGIQMQVHPKFHEIMKQIINDRIKKGKEMSGELSQKRLSLSFYKRLIQDPALYDWIVNVEINKDEI